MSHWESTGWNEQLILNLIELYREKPVIWDPKNENYFKKHLKFDALEEIGKAMGKPGQECKNKMMNLLSLWRRERAKENRSLGTGKGTDEIYTSHWFAYEALQFLKDRDQPRRGLSTNDNTSSDNGSEDASTTYTIKSSRKKFKPDPKLVVLKEALGILKSASEGTAPKESNQELRTFCDFLFNKMEKFDEASSNRLQQQMMQLVCYHEQTNCSVSASYYGKYPSKFCYATSCGNEQTSSDDN